MGGQMGGRIEAGICSGRRLFQGGVSACSPRLLTFVVTACEAQIEDLAQRLDSRSVVVLDGEPIEYVLLLPAGWPVVLLAGAQQDLAIPELLHVGVRGDLYLEREVDGSNDDIADRLDLARPRPRSAPCTWVPGRSVPGQQMQRG